MLAETIEQRHGTVRGLGNVADLSPLLADTDVLGVPTYHAEGIRRTSCWRAPLPAGDSWQAKLLQRVAGFQSFARQLHDLAAMTFARMSNADAAHWVELTTAITDDRLLDRGSADVHALQRDFRRLGIGAVNDKLGRWNARWPEDRSRVRILRTLTDPA